MKDCSSPSLAIAYGLKKRKKMADGGKVDPDVVQGSMDKTFKPDPLPASRAPDEQHTPEETVHRLETRQTIRKLTPEEQDQYNQAKAKVSSQAPASGTIPDHAEGGMIDHDEDDMVSRIMHKRHQMYSEGGKVANGGEDEFSHMADSKPNNFDVLSMDDDLEFHDTGANSGDELGNKSEDHDRHDIISRIMKSRAKKG